MKIAYLPGRARAPIPSLVGSLLRPRPVYAVRIGGPTQTRLIDGLLDTGSDDTVFEEAVAVSIGIDLNQAEQRQIGLVGRKQAVTCHYAQVDLSITDGLGETYEWTAVVGFVSTKLRYALLGYAGFLQFFNAEFRGADQEVRLTPNSTFPSPSI